jgi:hypothetical protein
MIKQNWKAIVPALVLVGFVVAGASPFASDGKDFVHKMHIEEGAECTTCHDTESGEGLPGLKKEACEDCHDEGAPGWKLPKRAARLPIRFPHKIHAEAGECKDCHEKTIEGSQVAGQPILTHADCLACHEENGVEVSGGNCAACHGSDPRKEPPGDHRHGWLNRHGEESKWRVFDAHGKDCSLCHRSATCLNCHKTRRPKNHSGLWRMRTHGLAAEWDRETCKTCHETGTCIRCHRSTEPLNHKGGWRATHGLAAQTRSNQHCAVCHNLSWCAACHQGEGH